jgi:hypothetical protein
MFLRVVRAAGAKGVKNEASVLLGLLGVCFFALQESLVGPSLQL